jgi:hypothetical protein
MTTGLVSGLGPVDIHGVTGTQSRFGSRAEGDRSQYVDIGKIDDELAGQNGRAPKFD